MNTIHAKDREILRGLAQKQMELARSPKNLRLTEEWKAHNSFCGARPMVHLELWTFQQEVVEPRLLCREPFAREIERTLYTHFLNLELFDDDKIVPDYYPVEWKTFFTPFGLEEKITHVEDGGLGHHFDPVLCDLEEDFEKLGPSVWGVDREATEAFSALLDSVFGDILPVKRAMNCLYSVPTQKIVHLMGMENMLFAMCDCPELFLKMMNRYADDTLAYYRWLEQEKLILPTVGGESLGQGTLCYTSELPGWDTFAERPFVSKDVWGFMDSQETVGISPDMFGALVFPCYRRIMEEFGLLSYGCCEPVHPIWDAYLSGLPNLRKVSISPWCDEVFMSERLRGKNIIYHRKPSPNYLGVGKTLDEDAFRAHIRASVNAARGCKLEITQRDVYTIHHDLSKARRYVEIIREEAERWQG